MKKLFHSKSIYKKKENKPIVPKIYDILQFGYPESRFLRLPVQNKIHMLNIKNNEPQEFIESIKLTASKNNLYSLSAPQIKQSLSLFCMYKDLSAFKWINNDPTIQLNKDNYTVIINPSIRKVSKICHYEYEECASFEHVKVKAKRPLIVQVNYFNEKGEFCETDLYDFEARVFMHEWEHLMGIPFIHWTVSEGEIEVSNKSGPMENLKLTVEYYKNRLRDTKLSEPDVFEMFNIPLLNKEMDNFHEDSLQLDYELRNKKKISFEDVMLIDIEKGIRKDLKLKLQRELKYENKL